MNLKNLRKHVIEHMASKEFVYDLNVADVLLRKSAHFNRDHEWKIYQHYVCAIILEVEQEGKVVRKETSRDTEFKLNDKFKEKYLKSKI